MWEGVEVTAVENDAVVVDIYQKLYPNDRVIYGDASKVLLDEYENFDFIWASPPCQSHSKARWAIAANSKRLRPVYPDMTLWKMIIFLQHHCDNYWCVENVQPYYDPLIMPTAKLHRHWFWANYWIPEFRDHPARPNISQINVGELQRVHGIDLQQYSIPGKDRRRQLLRNCVWPPLGNHVFIHAPLAENKGKNQNTQRPLFPMS